MENENEVIILHSHWMLLILRSCPIFWNSCTRPYFPPSDIRAGTRPCIKHGLATHIGCINGQKKVNPWIVTVSNNHTHFMLIKGMTKHYTSPRYHKFLFHFFRLENLHYSMDCHTILEGSQGFKDHSTHTITVV